MLLFFNLFSSSFNKIQFLFHCIGHKIFINRRSHLSIKKYTARLVFSKMDLLTWRVISLHFWLVIPSNYSLAEISGYLAQSRTVTMLSQDILSSSSWSESRILNIAGKKIKNFQFVDPWWCLMKTDVEVEMLLQDISSSVRTKSCSSYLAVRKPYIENMVSAELKDW